MKYLSMLFSLVFPFALLAEETLFIEDVVAMSNPLEPNATELSQSLSLMTSRDGSHFGTTRNWLAANLGELTAELEFELGAARVRVGSVGITPDAKGWDFNVLARTVFLGDRDATIVACTAWLGELKNRMGYSSNGDPNGQVVDFDGEVVGLVQLAHRHALDFKIPANSLASTYAQAGFVEAKSWLRVKVPYRDSSGVRDLTCSNRLDRASVQLSG